MSERIEVDDLTLHVHRSQRRDTIGITVERDGSLTAHVPIGVSKKTVENVVRSKAMWIYTKLAEKPHSSPSRVGAIKQRGQNRHRANKRENNKTTHRVAKIRSFVNKTLEPQYLDGLFVIF